MNSLNEIDGLKTKPLREIIGTHGSVLHLLRNDDEDYMGFGECYCSEAYPGSVKAWKRHHIQTQNLAVPVGHLRLVVFDDRSSSKTRGNLVVMELGRPDKYFRVSIPPGVWYGFTALGSVTALIVNCVDIPHDPIEVEYLPPSATHVPYCW
jgi:dTDP-4-dehydrorhamnose 3,5-epimerase